MLCVLSRCDRVITTSFHKFCSISVFSAATGNAISRRKMTETPDVTANHGHLGSVKILAKTNTLYRAYIKFERIYKNRGLKLQEIRDFSYQADKRQFSSLSPSLLFNMLGGTFSFSFSLLPSSSFLFRPLVKYRKFTLPKAIISPSQSVVFIEYNSQISHVERDYACSGGFLKEEKQHLGIIPRRHNSILVCSIL